MCDWWVAWVVIAALFSGIIGYNVGAVGRC